MCNHNKPMMLVALCGCLLLSTWVAAQQTGDIQLAHGTNTTGVIQLYNTDAWTSLCAWLFTDTEAMVACKQLGYLHGRALPPGAFGDLSGEGSYPEILQRCEGQKTRLVDCDFDENAVCSVPGVGYASVHCFSDTPDPPDSTLRLDGEPAYFSSVSVYAAQTWGRVCTTFWDDNDADVICRQFGYHGGIATFQAGDTTIPFLLTEINCAGSETSLSDCPTTPNVCDNDRSAAVVCYSNAGQAPTFSLVGGHSGRYGTVVFSVDGQQGLVCKSGLTWQEAYPLCQTMGFTSGSVLNVELSSPGVDSVVLAGVSCEGQEPSVYQCTVPPWSPASTQCQSGQQMGAVLYCYNSVRLYNGLQVETEAYHMGRVEIRDGDRWYAVCADTFDKVAASVTCRELGYPTAQLLTPDSFANRLGNKHVASLTCTGTEASLSECSYTLDRCNTSNKQVALLCTQQGAEPNTAMTLSSGYYGDIKVTMYGVQGTVCMAGWDNTEATVACQAAEHATGVVLAGSGPSNRYKPLWAFNFECMGGEDKLADCAYETTFNTRDWTCANDLTPAGVLCFNSTPPDTLVRIVDGRNAWEGRAEVYMGDNTWGTICNSGWSISDARVMCRELGYADGQLLTSGFSQADNSVEMVLANVKCDGDERSLFHCASSGWKRIYSSCSSHTKDAGVYCYRTITLDPTPTYGAVQYHDGDKHGLVCADSFAANAAAVVCRELDPKYTHSIPLCCSAFGPKHLEVAMSGVRCSGTENSLLECEHSTEDLTCSSGHYASVVCSQFNSGFNRITATPIVKISYFLHEGYVCTEDFTDEDATVLCKADGHLKGYAYKEDATGLEDNIRWLRGLNCVGTETRFQDCGTPNWGHIGTCSWDGVAATMCATTEEDMKFDVTLAAGTSSTVGRLHVYIQSQWGTVCGSHLTKSEAVVVCRQLGYHDGITMAPGSFGPGPGQVLLSGVKCQGDESSLKDCVWSGYGSPSQLCDHSKDAAIRCYSNVRIVGSTTVNYGRLEVYDDVESDWVAVCDRSQVVTNANLLCRQLGYVAGMFQKGSPLGPTRRKIAIVSMTCSTQDGCTFDRGICSSGEYMGLYCSESILVQEGVNIRLPGDSFYGPVSIQRFGLWGHVCSVGFDDNDAQVICLGLGYASGMALKTYQTEGYPIIQGNVQCLGDETSVASCDRTTFSEGHDCYDVDTVAAVMCYDVDGVTLGSTDTDHDVGQMQSYAEVVANGRRLRINMVQFEDVDAAIYCQALGFAGGDAFRRGNGAYGIAELSCTGTEETILQCPGVWDPSRTKDQQGDLAGVTCYTSVRLLEGDPVRYGAVYTSVGVNSGPVCADGFDDVDANVACRNLGHEAGLSLCCSPFGLLDDPGILTNVQCQGNEAQFTDCLHDNVSPADAEACKRDYAAVACFSGAKPTDYTLRIEGSSGYSGSLIMRYLDVDGSVCIDGWDDDDAHVACRELGFTRGVAYRATRLDSPSPFWTSELQCDGPETRLSECPMTELGKVTECRNMLSHAGVICYNNEGIYYQLGGSRESRYGRVEVSLNGEWNSLCNLHWESQDSQVLCKMLGFRTGEAYTGVLRDTFSGPVWEANFLCDGSEETLRECVSSGWRKSTVTACAFHQNDAAAFCYKSVKLSTGVGRQTDQGAVLFYYNDRWHTICNKGFTQVSAQVVCRELGFIDGQVQTGTSYGALLDYPRLTSHTVRCRGDETDVTDCLVEEPCNAQNYVSVVCYGFTLTTTAAPMKVEKSFDPVPVIIAVVLFVIVIIIGAIVLYCLAKRRKRRKLERSKQEFDDTILSENVDGSVEVSNRLHGLVDTPETSRVVYSNRNQAIAVERSYDNPAYNRQNLNTSESDAHKSIIQVGTSANNGYDNNPYDKIRSSRTQSTMDGSHPYDNLHDSQLQRERSREVERREDSAEKDNSAGPDMFISPFAASGVLHSPTDSHPEPSWKIDDGAAQ